MASNSNIEWTKATWNPTSGCSRKSSGCENCYAEKMTARLAKMGLGKYQGLLNEHGRFNGVVKFSNKDLLAPLKWKKPQKVFVNSMSDLFHENVPDEWIDKIFAVMALTPQHTYQILTKRPERMKAYLSDNLNDPGYWGPTMAEVIYEISRSQAEVDELARKTRLWPFPNVWLGVSVEDQKTADERIPLLLQTPAAVRWISAEPLLGPIDLTAVYADAMDEAHGVHCLAGSLNWVVVGGESGPKKRPFNCDWARSIRDQCKAAGVAYFFKQVDKVQPIPADLMIREFPR